MFYLYSYDLQKCFMCNYRGQEISTGWDIIMATYHGRETKQSLLITKKCNI